MPSIVAKVLVPHLLTGDNRKCGRYTISIYDFDLPPAGIYSMSGSKPPLAKRFPAAKQRQMDELLTKHANGSISPDEFQVLEKLVADAEELIADNAQRMSEFVASQPEPIPPQAIPVTVWVNPASSDSANR